MGGQGEVCLDCLACRDCETSEAVRRYRVFPRLSPALLQSSLDLTTMPVQPESGCLSKPLFAISDGRPKLRNLQNTASGSLTGPFISHLQLKLAVLIALPVPSNTKSAVLSMPKRPPHIPNPSQIFTFSRVSSLLPKKATYPKPGESTPTCNCAVRPLVRAV